MFYKLRVLPVLLVLVTISTICLPAAMGTPNQKTPVAGGYGAVSNADRDVVMVARYAIKAQRRKQRGAITLVRIERAEKQVVAGMNYRIILRVKNSGRIERVEAKVYENLKGKYSLSNWAILKPSKLTGKS